MKIIKPDELSDLTTESGGRFSVDSIDSAYSFCKNITINHYENFPVGSFLIPKKFRKYFYSIYAFARIADDIADESNEEKSIRIQYLDKLTEMLKKIDKHQLSEDEIYKNNSGFTNPIILALSQTIYEKNIPSEPFFKLLIAFKMDILFEQPKDFQELKNYCSYSANPIGELVLRIFGLYDESTKKYSDAICTGLQLLNFWQDLSIDLTKIDNKILTDERCYIPQKTLKNYSLNKENLLLKENSVNLSNCLSELYEITHLLLIEGKNLFKSLKYFRLKIEIIITVMSAEKLLGKLRKLDSQVFYYRPSLSKVDFIKVFFSSLYSK